MNPLAEFAKRKLLSLEYLDRRRVTDEVSGGIRFDYGGDARARIRKAAVSAHPTIWVHGDTRPMRVMGHQLVGKFAEQSEKTLLIVEGESDTLTAWFHHRLAVGVPGATMTHILTADDALWATRVIVVREPDEAGAAFVLAIASRLRAVGFSGEILELLLDPYKDVSELHVAVGGDRERFAQALDVAIASASAVDVKEEASLNASDGGVGVVATERDAYEWDELHPWPTLDRAAFYGLAGDIVTAIQGETEADPAALLGTLLVGFGNAAGPSAHARVHDDLHPSRLFVAIVGATSSGGKGTSLSTVIPFLRAADEEWCSECRKSGFGSGEAIIAEISGALRSKDEEGPIERRVLVEEPEFARLLTINGREGSTSSPILRRAWENGRLESRLSKTRMVATGAHLSLLAHISPEELRGKLSSLEVASGFANRMLFVLSRRARKLPSGGNIPGSVVSEFGQRLNEAIRFASSVDLMRRTPEAEKLWAQFYFAEPDREGIVGAVCNRWHAQKLRLSVTYALLDLSAEIRPEHVIAAEAFWRYCAGSAEHIWGAASGNSIADRIVAEARAAYEHNGDGLTLAEINNLFGRHLAEEKLRAAREYAISRDLVRLQRVDTGGRPATKVFAVPREKGDKREVSSLFSLLSLYSHRRESKSLAPVTDERLYEGECRLAPAIEEGL